MPRASSGAIATRHRRLLVAAFSKEFSRLRRWSISSSAGKPGSRRSGWGQGGDVVAPRVCLFRTSSLGGDRRLGPTVLRTAPEHGRRETGCMTGGPVLTAGAPPTCVSGMGSALALRSGG